MDLHEAIEWLDRRGGRWSVRATSAACMVVVVVGSAQIKVPASHLTRRDVDCALVGAVEQLRTRMQHESDSVQPYRRASGQC